MFEVLFYDLDVGYIRRVYTENINGVAFVLSSRNVDYENHFVKVRFVSK